MKPQQVYNWFPFSHPLHLPLSRPHPVFRTRPPILCDSTHFHLARPPISDDPLLPHPHVKKQRKSRWTRNADKLK
ncbi:hypothetical protein GBAR_LOCUS31767 [Geodia barretti]|uniref:Uncharacterized protein n=1 Tax=Geodia barretti TaxID=519541 RepID=A0AA35XI61_GEOBA|nr:hypothetical protein GBAR_LOCUS31767 [Geodia barretti]